MPLNNPVNPGQVYDLWIEAHHRSYLFPDDITKTATLTADGADNTFGTWAEIADNLGAKFSALTTSPIAVSSMQVREEDEADKLYLIEIGYGEAVEAVTTIDPHLFGSGTKKIERDEQVRFRPPVIPVGQKIYYRMKCEEGGATCQVAFRYHHH